jgi:putative ABC transport system permease protein
MLAHYLTIALRAFGRYKLHSALGVLSLAIGLWAFVAAYSFVTYVYSFESGFAKSERIYALYQALSFPNGFSLPLAPMTSEALAEHVRTEFPDLEAVARATEFGAVVSVGGDDSFKTLFAADPALLDIFDFPFVRGDAHNALAPGGVVITEQAARELFGTTEVLGRTVTLGKIDFAIAGVVGPIPGPSQFADSFLWDGFDLLVPWQDYERIQPKPEGADPWTWLGAFTFVLLPEDGSLTLERFAARLEGFAGRRMPTDRVTGRFEARRASQLLVDFYQTLLLRQSVGVVSVSAMFLVLGTLTLGIAVLNFVNLATAQAARRAREIGVRKAIGATGARVARQHLVETSVAVLVAFALAAFGVELTSRLLARREVVIGVPWGEPGAWAVFVALAICVTLAAAGYPAFLLARVHAVRALQAGSLQGGSRRLRGGLLALQFAGASFLVIAVTGMYAQNRMLRQRNAPDEDRVLVTLGGNLADAGVDLDTLRSELVRSRAVFGVTATSSPPWSWSWGGGRLSRSQDGSGQSLILQGQSVAHDYFETLGVAVLAGRVFSRDRADDVTPMGPADPRAPAASRKVVLDRTAAERFGWPDPRLAVGQMLYGGPNDKAGSEIIGVVESKPLTLVALTDTFSYQLIPEIARSAVVAIARDDLATGLAAVDDAWKRLAPHYPLRRELFDAAFESSYALFANVNRVFIGLAGLAFAIASSGLFGMASFLVARRTREIGVRKIHGAKRRQILELLLWSFSKPILLANVIALPLGWIGLRAYLDLFVQRTPLTPWPFVASLVTTLAIAWLAIAVHVVAATRVNPADVLRYQ